MWAVYGITAKHARFKVIRSEARNLPRVTSCLISKLDSIVTFDIMRLKLHSHLHESCIYVSNCHVSKHVIDIAPFIKYC